jgi:hypothetical protein
VHADEADIIGGLPSTLRTNLVMHLYRRAVEKVPLFRNKEPQLITAIVTCLRLEYYAPVREHMMRRQDKSIRPCATPCQRAPWACISDACCWPVLPACWACACPPEYSRR